MKILWRFEESFAIAFESPAGVIESAVFTEAGEGIGEKSVGPVGEDGGVGGQEG